MTHAVSVADTLAAVQGGMQSLAHTPHIDQRAQAQAETIANSEIPMMSTLETLTRARAAVTPSALVDEQQAMFLSTSHRPTGTLLYTSHM